MTGYLHHIQWSVANKDEVVRLLTDTWGGQALCQRDLETVVRLGSTLFLVSEKQPEAARTSSSSTSSSYPQLQCCHGSVCHHSQAVFCICLEVEDVAGLVERMVDQGSRLVIASHSITETDLGRVECAVVTSPCENVLHSLVNTKHYRGVFLPGFTPVSSPSPSPSQLRPGLGQVDHLTYVCRAGESQDILQWYSLTCGMQTFVINPSQASDVVDVEGEAGLRLRVGEWMEEWLCREVGGEIPPPPSPVTSQSSHQHRTNFKLVLAEPLGEGGHVNRRVTLYPATTHHHGCIL